MTSRPSHPVDPEDVHRRGPVLTFTQLLARSFAKLPLRAVLRSRLINRARHLAGDRGRSGRFLTTFDGDLRIVTSLEDHIESQIFWQGYQKNDRGKLILWKRLVQGGGAVLDVGANVGIFTLTAAKRTAGEIHAFEPAPEAFRRLESNVRLNGFSNTVLNDFALADRPGHRALWVPRRRDRGAARINRGKASFYELDDGDGLAEQEMVAVTTLDQYLATQGLSGVAVVKLDVEGAEIDVLEGARKTLADERPHLLLEVDGRHLRRAGREVRALFDLLKPFGYEIAVIHDEGTFAPIAEAGELRGHTNLYCFHHAPGN